MNELIIEKAQPEHADKIWEMIYDGFGGSHSQYLATGQPGYRVYLEDRLLRDVPSSTTLIVAKVRDYVAAFADVTFKAEGPNFLTRIAVSRDFRGKGLAREMMHKIHEMCQVENRWELDVLSTNGAARKMYKTLGFETISRRKWVGRLIPQRVAATQVTVENRDTEDMHYLRYGFTHAQLDNYTISIAGTAARCHVVDSFMDDMFLNEVQAKFPSVDRAFIILDISDTRLRSNGEVFEIVRSERLVGSF